MINRIGDYDIVQNLGSWSQQLTPPGLLGPNPNAFYKVEIGVNGILSIRKLLEHDNDFEVSPDIKVQLGENNEFYKISLVIDFSHGSKLKFHSGIIKVDLDRSQNAMKPQVYSISPLKVNDKQRITREFVIDPQLQLTEATNVSGGSYTSKKEYIKLHPQIVGHFSAGQEASWEFMTNDSVDDVIGAQLVEFIVRQPAGTRTEWRVLPDGKVKWAGLKQKFTAFFTDDKLPAVKSTFKTFTIPS